MITIQKFHLYSLKISAYVKISVECFEYFGGANVPNVPRAWSMLSRISQRCYQGGYRFGNKTV